MKCLSIDLLSLLVVVLFNSVTPGDAFFNLNPVAVLGSLAKKLNNALPIDQSVKDRINQGLDYGMSAMGVNTPQNGVLGTSNTPQRPALPAPELGFALVETLLPALTFVPMGAREKAKITEFLQRLKDKGPVSEEYAKNANSILDTIAKFKVVSPQQILSLKSALASLTVRKCIRQYLDLKEFEINEADIDKLRPNTKGTKCLVPKIKELASVSGISDETKGILDRDVTRYNEKIRHKKCRAKGLRLKPVGRPTVQNGVVQNLQ